MNIKKTPIQGLLELQPNILKDDRGYFLESWNKEELNNKGFKFNFVQDNQSYSQKNILRGIHFQLPPFDQGKLVRVVQGSAIDVAVDLRKKSPTYGKHHKVLLSDKKQNMFWIPNGFGHGFISLQNNTLFLYKCTNYYDKKSECSIIWNDPSLNINWGISNPILSEKDLQGISFKEFNSPFTL